MIHDIDVTINGLSYSMCYTLQAASEFADRYGSMTGCLEKVEDLAKDSDGSLLISEYLWMAHTLLEAGNARRCTLGWDPVEVPGEDVLASAFTPGELEHLVAKALVAGSAREVGTQPPKNGEGAVSTPAPQ